MLTNVEWSIKGMSKTIESNPFKPKMMIPITNINQEVRRINWYSFPKIFSNYLPPFLLYLLCAFIMINHTSPFKVFIWQKIPTGCCFFHYNRCFTPCPAVFWQTFLAHLTAFFDYLHRKTPITNEFIGNGGVNQLSLDNQLFLHFKTIGQSLQLFCNVSEVCHMVGKFIHGCQDFFCICGNFLCTSGIFFRWCGNVF